MQEPKGAALREGRYWGGERKEQSSYQGTKSGINNPRVQFRFSLYTELVWTLAEQWCKTTTEQNGMEATRCLKSPAIPAWPSRPQTRAFSGTNAASSRLRPAPPGPPDSARSSSESTSRSRYLILLPVFMRIHCGMGRFCFCFLARKRLILNVLCDDCKRAQRSVPQAAPAPPGLGEPGTPRPAPSRSLRPAARPPRPPSAAGSERGLGERREGADGRGCLTMARSGAASRRWRRPKRRKEGAERRRRGERGAPCRPGGPARSEGRRRPSGFVRVLFGFSTKNSYG